MNLKDIPFDKVYIITLPHNQERLGYALEQLDRIGIRPSVFRGIYPKKLDIAHNDAKFTQGMLGCFLSHYMIFHEAVANGWESFLVFEDDLELVPGFDYLMMSALKQMPEDWEFVWLGYTIHDGVDKNKIVRHNPYWLTSPSSWGTQAYMVRGKSAIAKIFDALQTMTDQIDLQLVQDVLPKNNIKQYAIYPSAIGQTGVGTDVQHPSSNNLNQRAQEFWL